jgi:hypothetical protein
VAHLGSALDLEKYSFSIRENSNEDRVSAVKVIKEQESSFSVRENLAGVYP